MLLNNVEISNIKIALQEISNTAKQISSLASSIGRAFDSYSREAIKRLRVRSPRRVTIFFSFSITSIVDIGGINSRQPSTVNKY